MVAWAWLEFLAGSIIGAVVSYIAICFALALFEQHPPDDYHYEDE